MQATKVQAHRREQSASKGSSMTPMMLTLILILIPTVTGVAGQLLLKVGMSQLGALEISVAAIPSLIMRIILSPYIIVGLAIYFGGVFLLAAGAQPRRSELRLSFRQSQLRLDHAGIMAAAPRYTRLESISLSSSCLHRQAADKEFMHSVPAFTLISKLAGTVRL
jgi:hypothetical protein